MKRNQYKQIVFQENYSGTFEQFQKQFEDVWVFRVLEPKEKLAELKKAFEIATSKKVQEEKK